MAKPKHTVAEVARHWRHPEVLKLRAVVNATDPEDSKAYRSALNAIRDKIEELKKTDRPVR